MVHPFPSLLDGIATSAIASIAGADALTSVRLGLAMVSLQASIGALNDLVDAPVDAGLKPAKPIPAGIVSAPAARIVVAAGVGLGFLLAAPSGVVLVALAAGILAIGYAYDLRAKGTAWSWLPLAVGIPLLPVFGWFGATGRLPAAFALLLPLAFATGAGLAIANARADLERDAAGGVESVAIRLGSGRAWLVEASLLVAVAAVAIATLWLRGASPAPMIAAVTATVVIVTGLVVGRRGAVPRRQRAWELEAIGVAGLAAAWLAGIGGLS